MESTDKSFILLIDSVCKIIVVSFEIKIKIYMQEIL